MDEAENNRQYDRDDFKKLVADLEMRLAAEKKSAAEKQKAKN